MASVALAAFGIAFAMRGGKKDKAIKAE